VQITFCLDLKTNSSTLTDNPTPTGSTLNLIENRDDTASQSNISDPPKGRGLGGEGDMGIRGRGGNLKE
jgi:hypothetical protein